MSKIALPTVEPVRRVITIGVDSYNSSSFYNIDDSLDELEQLATTAGLLVVGRMSQKLRSPNPSTYIGSGKLQELISMVELTAADIVLFDSELSPRNQRELEKIFDKKIQILDRTALILDIFATNSNTREGGLQVELAQYEYRLPRLTRQWTHLARQAGGASGRTGSTGGVGLRGPGEKQLEVDRREITRRITKLKQEIGKIRRHRAHHRKRRKISKVPIVSMVGYTNTGKSSLLRKLSNTDVLVADKLFATLDPTTRRIECDAGRSFLLTDTVGFIQKLPSTVTAAFRATLEEILEADLLLHVIDVNHKCLVEHSKVVLKTLDDIGVQDIPMITVLNKVDLVQEASLLKDVTTIFPDAIPVSAWSGYGLGELTDEILSIMSEAMVGMTVCIPYTDGGLISMFHEYAISIDVHHGPDSVKLTGDLPASLIGRFRQYKC